LSKKVGGAHVKIHKVLCSAGATIRDFAALISARTTFRNS
jgi:hypothetical protein